MKAIVICKRLVVISAICFTSFLVFSDTLADIAGGSGYPITPYRPYSSMSYEEFDVNENTVTQLKEYSSSHRHLSYDSITTGINRFVNVGIGYARFGKIEGRVEYKIRGIDDNKERAEVSFSEIESFKLVEKKGKICVFEINRFPAITPKELIEKQPTYAYLRRNHFLKKRIHMLVETFDGKKRFFVGRYDNSDIPYLLYAIDEIPLNTEFDMSFYREGAKPSQEKVLWWAIPSVVEDPAYPFIKVNA